MTSPLPTAPTPTFPRGSGPPSATTVWRRIGWGSVVIANGTLVAGACMAGAVLISFCGLFGTQCPPAELAAIDTLSGAAIGVAIVSSVMAIVIAAVPRALWVLCTIVVIDALALAAGASAWLSLESAS